VGDAARGRRKAALNSKMKIDMYSRADERQNDFRSQSIRMTR